MEAFTTLTAVAAPFDRPNTDPDQITPDARVVRACADALPELEKGRHLGKGGLRACAFAGRGRRERGTR